MKTPIVLAYAGGLHASAAIAWLIETQGVEVVTVTLDVGQGQDLGELRDRALACGAVRAHIFDARDEFARQILLPSLRTVAAGDEGQWDIAALPRPLIARKLIEVAGLEGARTVAHGSSDVALDAEIHAIESTLDVIAPAREWSMNAADLAAYARARRLPVQIPAAADARIDENLWGRTIAWNGDAEPVPARAEVVRRPAGEAMLDIHFERGVPTSVNGVPMSPAELIESLSLIAGQHGVGRVHPESGGSRHVIYDVPAAVVLHAAVAALDGSATGDVCLKLFDGQYTVLTPHDRHSLLVNYA